MTKKRFKRVLPMVVGSLIIALVLSIIPGNFLVEASKDFKSVTANKDIVEVVKIKRNVFSRLKTDNYIPLESAEAIALSKINDNTSKITGIEVELIEDQVHYIVEVTTYNKEINKIFKIKINGITGNIKDVEIKDPVKDPVKEGEYITKEEAIKIARAKIGKDAKLDEIEFEDDDDTPIYEIEMHDDKYEYEIDIDAITGEILKFKKERD